MRCRPCDVTWLEGPNCWVCGVNGEDGWSYVPANAPDFDYMSPEEMYASWVGWV